MKIYFAGSIKSREEVKAFALEVCGQKHESTSTWLSHYSTDGNILANSTLCRAYAEEDIDDIRRANIIIMMIDGFSPGKYIECGLAIEMGKPVFAIGIRTSVFHHCGNFVFFENKQKFIEWFNNHSEAMESVLMK